MGNSGLPNPSQKALEDKDLCIQRESLYPNFYFSGQTDLKGKMGGLSTPSYHSQIYQPDHSNSLHSPQEATPKVLTVIETLHMGTLGQGKECPQTSLTSKHFF